MQNTQGYEKRTANEFISASDHSPQAEMVRKSYNDINCLYGIYSPDYFNIAQRVMFGLILCLIDGCFTSFFIFLMVKYTYVGLCIGLTLATIALNCLIGYACISLNCGIRNIYFYKYNGKLVTVHYNKFLKYLMICLETDGYYIYNFKKKSWKQEVKKEKVSEIWNMRRNCGSYLLFPYLYEDNARKNGIYVKVQNKIKNYGKNKTKIISSYYGKGYNDSHHTNYIFVNEKLQYIKHSYSYLGTSHKGGGLSKRWTMQYLRIYETNVIHCMEIPKSFIDFCKSQGIDPPEECEHLHYVDIVKNK